MGERAILRLADGVAALGAVEEHARRHGLEDAGQARLHVVVVRHHDLAASKPQPPQCAGGCAEPLLPDVFVRRGHPVPGFEHGAHECFLANVQVWCKA